MKSFLLGLIGSTLMMGGLMIYLGNPNFKDQVAVNLMEAEDTNSSSEVSTEQTPLSEDLTQILKKGDALFQEAYYEAASKEYEKAKTMAPDNAEILYKLGESYFKQEAYSEALDNFTLATKKQATHAKAQEGIGKTLIEQEQFKLATTHFESMPIEGTLKTYYRGLMTAFNGDYEGAKIHFESVALSEDPLANRAAIFLRSMAEYSAAQDPDPNYVKTLMARSFVESDQLTLGIQTLYKVLEENPDYRDAWLILGYSYLQKEELEEAQEALFRAVEIDPSHESARYFLGETYFKLGNYNSAITQIELALEAGFKPVFDGYQIIADSATAIQDYEKAVSYYEKMLILENEDVNQYIRPIWIYIDHLKNPEKAAELASRAVSEHPNNAMSYNLLGWAQIAQEELTEAEKSLNYAIILDSNLAAAYLNFGILYETQGDLEKAKENYKKAYSLDNGGSIGNRAGAEYNRLVETTTQPSTPPPSPTS